MSLTNLETLSMQPQRWMLVCWTCTRLFASRCNLKGAS